MYCIYIVCVLNCAFLCFAVLCELLRTVLFIYTVCIYNDVCNFRIAHISLFVCVCERVCVVNCLQPASVLYLITDTVYTVIYIYICVCVVVKGM